jgi:hypothetical protein
METNWDSEGQKDSQYRESAPYLTQIPHFLILNFTEARNPPFCCPIHLSLDLEGINNEVPEMPD